MSFPSGYLTEESPVLLVRHHPWATPPRRPRMANDDDVRPGVALTSRALLRDGVPVIPVSGELHYSRVPTGRWRQRLRQMRAGGVTVVASYVFWLHHVEHRGAPRFDGNLDVAAFADLCAAEGLDLILRIGPWCHGETRNGGFPDWVQQAPVRHRTDDPGYLALVREWFGQLGRHLDGRPLLGLQLENELYDQPGHLVTLKRLARRAGMSAPLWTATAWGSAELPADEVLPLYGGYGDGFWVDAGAPWDPTFRDHYFFSHVWDDPGIGADLRRLHEVRMAAGGPRTPSELFPPATCELGGGMATAYHRRPRPAALDVAAIAHCKIGNGSAWQGYYMYAGGTNPAGTLGMQESHATGYPNDLPRLGYDFHAPIGEAGVLAASHAELRRQHAFLAAFGSSLADMPSSLPEQRPAGVEDTSTLRWALRADGHSGFLFIAWHQPHVPLPDYRGARFRVTLDDGDLVLPSRPVDIPAGTLARWPLRVTAGGVRLDWVTASAVTLLPGPVPTLVLTASAGLPVEYAVDGVAHPLEPSRVPVRVSAGGATADLLVLPAADESLVWVCSDGPAGRRLLLSADELSWGPDGQITAGGPSVLVYDPASRAFAPLPLSRSSAVASASSAVATASLVRAAGRAVPVAYGKFDGRPSAPSAETFEELAAVYRLELPAWAADPSVDALLRIGWAGDIGRLRVDSRTVTDRFWDGSEWIVSLRDAGFRAGSRVSLHLLPLAAGSPVSLPRDARDRLLASDGQLLALDYVRIAGRTTRHEAGGTRNRGVRPNGQLLG
jgi:beta-galactosidase